MGCGEALEVSRCARHDSAFVVDMTALLLGTDPSIWKESGAFGPSIYAVMLSTEIKCARQKRCHVERSETPPISPHTPFRAQREIQPGEKEQLQKRVGSFTKQTHFQSGY